MQGQDPAPKDRALQRVARSMLCPTGKDVFKGKEDSPAQVVGGVAVSADVSEMPAIKQKFVLVSLSGS